MPDTQPSLHSALLKITRIPMIAVMMILLGIIALSAYLIQQEIIERQRLVVQTLARQGEQYLQETTRLMNALAYGMTDLSTAQQQRLLAQARVNYPHFSAFYLLNSAGKVLVEASGSAFVMEGLDMSRGPFFAQARDTERFYFSEPFLSLSTRQITVTGAVPIFLNKRFQGMLVGELNLQLLQHSIEQIDGLPSSLSCLIEQRGTVIAHPERIWVQEQRNLAHIPLVRQALKGEEGYEVFYDVTQEAWVIGSVAHMAENWVVFTIQPLMIAARPLLILVAAAIVAFGLSFSLFFWGLVRNLRKVTVPIVDLTQQVDALASGHYTETAPPPDNAFYEIMQLHRHFTSMARSIEDHTTELIVSNTALNNELRERRWAEEEIRTLNSGLEKRVQQRTAELEALNKELNNFAHIVSHDLKAPLRGINQLSQWFIKDYADLFDDEGKKLVTLLSERVLRMSRLIDGVLTYSRAGQLEQRREELNLNTLVLEIIDSIAPPEHIQIGFGSTLPVISGDKTRFIQLFQNLLSNAVKFIDKPKGTVSIDCVDDDAFWRFGIADNGPGIAPQYHEKIFQIFQSFGTQTYPESTGIGLSVVKKTIELYGGKIWVESEPGKGSTFFFTLHKSQCMPE